MKSAVFALLYSSVLAQPKYGSESWDRTLKEHKIAMNMMAEKGFNMNVNLDPKPCKRSRDCGLPFRVGGCCF